VTAKIVALVTVLGALAAAGYFYEDRFAKAGDLKQHISQQNRFNLEGTRIRIDKELYEIRRRGITTENDRQYQHGLQKQLERLDREIKAQK